MRLGVPVEYDYKFTSELTQSEIEGILLVLNEAYGKWGDEAFFRWKYTENPDGDSLHVIAYDDGKPVATAGFWRNGPPKIVSYQCVDAAIIPSHRRRGIYQVALNGCSERLKSAYVYTFTGDASRPTMMNCGWDLTRNIPLKFHLAPMVVRKYRNLEPIPEAYAEWRFAGNPHQQYFVYKKGGLSLLLSKRRDHVYAVGGVLPNDLGLEEVRPILLFSYDFPNLPFKIPKKTTYYFIENPISALYEGYLPSHYSDQF